MFKLMYFVRAMVMLRPMPWLVVMLKTFRVQLKVNGEPGANGIISKFSSIES